MFLLMSQMRTYSGLLCSLLNSHPDLGCVHEVLKAKEIRTPGAFDLVKGMTRKKNPIVHGQIGQLTDEFLEMDIPKVLLTRKDYALASESLFHMKAPRACGYHAPKEPNKLYSDIRKAADKKLASVADFVIDASDIATSGEETNVIENDKVFELLDFLNVKPMALKSQKRRGRQSRPGNIHTLRKITGSHFPTETPIQHNDLSFTITDQWYEKGAVFVSDAMAVHKDHNHLVFVLNRLVLTQEQNVHGFACEASFDGGKTWTPGPSSMNNHGLPTVNDYGQPEFFFSCGPFFLSPQQKQPRLVRIKVFALAGTRLECYLDSYKI